VIRLRKYGGIAIALLATILAVQAGVSLLVRTHRLRGYLTRHLESAFGRPVEAGRFSVQILPIPELGVDAVTIGEDPAFGNEYFLRAEHMTARFRWMGLLRGHFEFGTMSFTRPSLILVRNADDRWNLEGWLPPTRPAGSLAAAVWPRNAQAEPTHLLQKIDFDDGRINFKLGNEKRPFAFTNVSGSVEQVSSGRWQLQLEATPWRSGVQLQSTGTLQVAGYVAGTSARLQPAQIQLHWDKASIADLFRLITGNDSGVRGDFALDGKASIGMGTAATEAPSSEWRFVLQARARNIHRWDLTERDDNPRINLSVKGLWAFAAGEAQAEEVRMELPDSRMIGTAVMQTSSPVNWKVHFQNMAVQGDDLLAWYRAFQPNIADGVELSDLISGSLTASGWPLRWEDVNIESTPGTLHMPGQVVARLDPFHGSVRNGAFTVEGFRMKLPAEAATQTEKTGTKSRSVALPENSIEAGLSEDTLVRQGALRLNVRLADVTSLFKLTSAFGYSLNKGWEYKGGASGTLAWNWTSNPKEARRSGSLELTKARLQIAGLNEPLKVEAARLEWKDGLRNAALAKVDAFGAAWSGTISEKSGGIGSEDGNWHFQLHADHLDATELDRWVGPRSRPNWLERLLPSLLGSANTAQASELLRRVSAEGELTTESMTIEKIKLAKVRASLALHALHLDVRDAEAQWAGGVVHGDVQALFSPLPKYEMNAEIESVNLAQLPWSPRWGERWSGLASGKIHLSTNGVGREDLLKQLAGGGEVRLNKIEFRGWDVEESAQSGGLSLGASRWTSGEGEFQLSDQKVHLDGLRLDAPHQRTELAGTISFGMDGNLVFSPRPRILPGARVASEARELRVSGQLENPAVAVSPVATNQARP
jgi:AsmA family/AsmA-like C-terminal region